MQLSWGAYRAHAREGLTSRWCHFYFYHNSNQTSTACFAEPENLTIEFIWTSKGSELAKKIQKYKTGDGVCPTNAQSRYRGQMSAQGQKNEAVKQDPQKQTHVPVES